MINVERDLSARLVPLADPRDDQSWAEVVARARAARRHRRRVPITIAAALATAVVIASPATGVRGQIVRLFDRGKPAPQRVVKSFAEWNGPQLRAGVQAGRALKVLDARIAPDTTRTLWVAPTKGGGFCTSLGACYEPGFRYDRLSVEVSLRGVAPDGEILTGPVLLSGETTNKRATSLLLRFQDGERQTIPLVWVGEPVDTAFFLYGVPKQHWQAGHLPTTLTMLSAEGDELDTREITGITTKGSLTP